MPDDSESRPYWLTEPCPPWCLDDHQAFAEEPPSLWFHLSEPLADLQLTTEPEKLEIGGEATYNPWVVDVHLEQRVREIGPRVVLANACSPTQIHFTPDEAQQLADALVKAVRLATDHGGTRHE